MDVAVPQSTVAVMANMGQICCAGTRTYVQADIYGEFVKRSVELAKKRTVGDPLDPANDNGAQVCLFYYAITSISTCTTSSLCLFPRPAKFMDTSKS